MCGKSTKASEVLRESKCRKASVTLRYSAFEEQVPPAKYPQQENLTRHSILILDII